MNEFVYLVEAHTQDRPEPSLLELSLRLARTPCSPLYNRQVSLDRELAAFLSNQDPR